MTEYEMNWQAESYRAQYELLNAKVKQFSSWLDEPVISSFFIVNGIVRPKFDELFDV